MPKEMIFLVEQPKPNLFKASNLNLSIKTTAGSYDEIKKNIQHELLKLDYILRPETVRYRFIKEEITSIQYK